MMKTAVLTLNPGIDRVIYLDGPARTGTLNRAARVVTSQGSKGANVAIMLKRLGVEPEYIAFSGGELGDIAERFTDEAEIKSHYVRTKCGVRMNVKVIGGDGCCTEFNERGGPVTPDELDEITELLTQGGFGLVVLTGSLPIGADSKTYERLIRKLGESGTLCVLDCDGDALRHGVAARPALIKPNRRELAGLLGVEVGGLYEKEALLDGMRKIREKYGCDVICTLDSDGSVYSGSDGEWAVTTAPVRLVGFTGAGDTYLSGYIFKKYFAGEPTPEALKYASAAASAKVTLEGTRLPDAGLIGRYLPMISCESIKF